MALDPRRRSVMPTASGIRSGIPQPVAALPVFKKPEPVHRAMRMSIAPGRAPLASSTNIHASVPASNPRQSVYRASAMQVPASAMKPAGAPKDPRPVRDRGWQGTVQRRVYEFIRDQPGFPGEITLKMVAQPIAREFQAIFKFLVSILDPSYVFGRADRRFEDEAGPLLKALRYPFADAREIKPQLFQTPGSMSSMYIIVGILDWLLVACIMRCAYNESDDPTLQDAESCPPDFDDDYQRRAIELRYIDTTYGLFLAGGDEFDDADKWFEEKYGLRNRSLVESVQTLQKELDALSAEQTHLASTESPLVALQSTLSDKKGDYIKFERQIANHRQKIARYKEDLAAAHDMLARTEEEITGLRRQQQEFEDIVKGQKISYEQALSMTRERESLTKTVEDLKQKVEATRRATETLEVRWANGGDKLEQATDDYTSLAVKLKLDPTPPPPYEDVNFSLTIDLAHEIDPSKEVHFQSVIMPALAAIAAQKLKAKNDIKDEQLKIEHELDKISAECDALDEDIRRLLGRVDTVKDQTESVRETAQAEAQASDAEAAKLDRDIANARAMAKTHGFGIKSRLQALEIARQEQILRTDRLRDETIKAISKHAEEIYQFKLTVSECLDELGLFAEAN